MEEDKDLERFSLIDVFSEDDVFLVSPQGIAKSPCLVESNEEILRLSFQSSIDSRKTFSPISNICSIQEDSVPAPSDSPKPNKCPGRYNLRKSLAWDKAFFTSAGVLDPEELANVNTTFRDTKKPSLAEIPEERKSSDSHGDLKQVESPSKLHVEPKVIHPLPSEDAPKSPLLSKVGAQSKGKIALSSPHKTCKIPKLPPSRRPLVNAQSSLQTKAKSESISGGRKSSDSHGDTEPKTIPLRQPEHAGSKMAPLRPPKPCSRIPKLPPSRRPLVNAQSTTQTREKTETHPGALGRSKDSCHPTKGETGKGKSSPKAFSSASPSSSVESLTSVSSSSSFPLAGRTASSAPTSQLTATSARSIPKSVKPSLLQPPTPKIGYFDAEQSQKNLKTSNRRLTSSKAGNPTKQ